MVRVRTAVRTGILLVLVAARLAYAQGGAAEDDKARKPGEIQQPKGTWQIPGEIQKPKGTWQTPGEIQKPGEIQRVEERCRLRLIVAADALFDFDRHDLTSAAETALGEIGPALAGHAGERIVVEGHTDSFGSDAYNQELSEKRARSVRDWLAARGFLPASTPILGHGESVPIAPNTHPDGTDNPDGRSRNRRVEIVVETCKGS